MEESKVHFERFLREEHLYSNDELIWEDERNCYSIYSVHIAWKAWQASRAAIEIELPMEDYAEDFMPLDIVVSSDEVKSLIHAAGLKIKGE